MMARKIRKDPALKDLPILIITGIREQIAFMFPGQAVHPNFVPLNELIEKPVEPDLLLERVGALLQAAEARAAEGLMEAGHVDEALVRRRDHRTRCTRPARAGLNCCIQCATCSAACPAVEFMDHTPRRLIGMINAGLKDEVLASNTFWTCASCYACSRPLPQGDQARRS